MSFPFLTVFLTVSLATVVFFDWPVQLLIVVIPEVSFFQITLLCCIEYAQFLCNGSEQFCLFHHFQKACISPIDRYLVWSLAEKKTSLPLIK